MNWPADHVERRPLAELVPYAKNARTHSPAQIAQVAASMREWGWTNPVLIDKDGTIIAGHARVMAAQSLGFADVPVMIARGWSDAQKRAYVIADNKLGLNAGWDDELLRIEFADLNAMGFGLELTGFSADELQALRPNSGLVDPDQVPEPPAVPVTRPGDVWLLGQHRLVCGDCTEPAVVGACVGQEKPHLMVTDPPYGVEYDPAWRDERAKMAPSMGNRKDTAKGRVVNDDQSDWRAAWDLFLGDVAYVWHGHVKAIDVGRSLESAGFEIRQAVIWDKGRIAVGRSHYQWQHEPCWYAVRKGRTGHWNGDRTQTTVWDIPMPHKSETGHGTQKPVECMRRPIENNSKVGDRVYDPFVGSGTSIIATEITGRICHAIELDPVYCDVVVKRWEDFTGGKAVLERAREEVAA